MSDIQKQILETSPQYNKAVAIAATVQSIPANLSKIQNKFKDYVTGAGKSAIYDIIKQIYGV